ncbi:hypothetical protein ACFP2T_30645 [Plantactinospora solaniradicis]|uniref:Uncharacterized protein n=1 Tax=Plantactinospora solaniradicis TaxID=1723736 RepID=A0ABW1KHB0_9ACTN
MAEAPEAAEAPPAADSGGGPTADVPPQPGGPGARSSKGGDAPSGGDSPMGAGFATGSPECCVCPVCRSIAALRDPSPEFAERLATGAGDFAAGVASLLRAFSSVAGNTGNRAETTSRHDTGAQGSRPGTATATASRADADGVDTPDAPSAGPSSVREDAVWREATRTRHDSWPADDQDVWAAATRAEAGAQETGATADPDRSTSAGTGGARPAGSSAAGRPPVPASRTPEGPVTAGPGEQVAPDQGP